MFIRLIYVPTLLITMSFTTLADESIGTALDSVSTWMQSGRDSAPMPVVQQQRLFDGLRDLPDGHPDRIRACSIAWKLIHELPNEDDSSVEKTRGIGLAWSILVGGNMLREGMLPEQVSAILGAPTKTNAHGDLIWYSATTGSAYRLALTLAKDGSAETFVQDFERR